MLYPLDFIFFHRSIVASKDWLTLCAIRCKIL
ncbi:unnamed protein product [Spirodela intermedia]|uniref:Uncharacterized protein n=1 Tax=Spirodela intermedia TaxID=51605 RepID=A0A7I8JS93_SPIIN|nr:unnamed protein product [Spirodela intermedia]CAA6672631.1 unnamed protein product [Spirodela intermedia]